MDEIFEIKTGICLDYAAVMAEYAPFPADSNQVRGQDMQERPIMHGSVPM